MQPQTRQPALDARLSESPTRSYAGTGVGIEPDAASVRLRRRTRFRRDVDTSLRNDRDGMRYVHERRDALPSEACNLSTNLLGRWSTGAPSMLDDAIAGAGCPVACCAG